MLFQANKTRQHLQQLTDGALFVLSLGLAYILRSSFQVLDLPEIEAFSQHLWLFPIVAILGPTMLTQQGFYERSRLPTRIGSALIIVRSCLYTVLGLIFLLFLLRAQFARSVVIMVGGFAGILIYARHEFWRWLATRRAEGGTPRWHVLWVGLPDESERAREALSSLERHSLRTVGFFNPHTHDLPAFVELLHQHNVNIVVVSLTGLEQLQGAAIFEACAREGIEVVIRPGLFRGAPVRLALDRLGGEPVMYFRAQAASPTQLLFKQILDYVGGAFLLFVLSPVFLVVALAVKLTSPGPLLYIQQRAGLNGRPFRLYKFRSMVVDADARKADLAALNEMTGPVFKVANDPRVTPIGRLLRRHSLDELPQLFNVIKGDMSLVGPRPLPVDEIARISDYAHRRRLSVKPGLTCLWQVQGRNDIADFEDWVRLDLNYIDDWSFWLDLRILLATVPVALFGRGAR